MTDPTLPPVGATVVDADGVVWQHLGHHEWLNQTGGAGLMPARMMTTLWRSEQARKALEAELAAFRALAVEAKALDDVVVPMTAFSINEHRTACARMVVERLAALAPEVPDAR